MGRLRHDAEDAPRGRLQKSPVEGGPSRWRGTSNPSPVFLEMQERAGRSPLGAGMLAACNAYPTQRACPPGGYPSSPAASRAAALTAPGHLPSQQAGVITVCCGGGGIPVAVNQGTGARHGVEAVVDKDEGEGQAPLPLIPRPFAALVPACLPSGKREGCPTLPSASAVATVFPLLLPCSLCPAGDPPAGRLAADADRQADRTGLKVSLGTARPYTEWAAQAGAAACSLAGTQAVMLASSSRMPADAAAIYDPTAWPKEEQPIPSPATCSQLQSMQFASGSMAPKVAAACRFVAATGGRAAVGSMEDALRIVEGQAGTVVVAG